MVIESEVCFTVNRIFENEGFSEIDDLAPLEIPLLATILLCAEKDEARIFPYPTHQSLRLSCRPGTQLNEDLASEAGQWLTAYMKSKKYGSRWPTDFIHLSRALGGMAEYSLIPSSERTASREMVLSFLKSSNPVYLRGVASLIKANMASRHPELFESALLSLWIAMDAAHSIILRRLRDAGIKNPSSKDAASFVYDAYGVEGAWEKFFEEDYETRIRFNHPDNRYGAEARPWATADGFYELNENLVDLYYFLATGVPRDTQR
jgi:hypothetical protein